MVCIDMDSQGLPEADKHLIYGLLLKKKRSAAQERKALSIVRSALSLDAKIQAILQITRAQVLRLPLDSEEKVPGPGKISNQAASKKKRTAALVVDSRTEITNLLKKCSLKREFSFFRVAERFDAVHLIPSFHARLIIVNDSFPDEGEYSRYFEICRAVEPAIRILYLGLPPQPVEAGPAFQASTRFLSKPLNVGVLEESVKALHESKGKAQAYKPESSR
jgi:hypothetical protein